MRILLDANVVLDLLLDRQPWAQHARPLLERILAEQIQAFVAATTITNIFYVARPMIGDELSGNRPLRH